MVGAGIETIQPEATDSMQLFKVLLFGDAKVGKSAFIRKFISGDFESHYVPTIGIDFASKYFKMPNGEKIKLQVWDTAGEERFRTITTSYYRGVSGVFVMFDVTDSDTYESVDKHILDVRKLSGEKCIVIIVGNKADKDGAERQVTTEEAEKFAKYAGCPYFESSAKENLNIDNIIQSMTESILKVNREKEMELASKATAPGPLKKKEEEKKKSKTCVIL